MLHLGYVGQVEVHFGLFGDSVNLRASKVHGLCRKYHRLRNHLDAPDATLR
jgi:hypothetical protein